MLNNQMIVCDSRLKIIRISDLQIQLLLQHRTHLLLTHPSGLNRSGIRSRSGCNRARSGSGAGAGARLGGSGRSSAGRTPCAVTEANSCVANGHIMVRNDGLERDVGGGGGRRVGRSTVNERVREGRIVGRSGHIVGQSTV